MACSKVIRLVSELVEDHVGICVRGMADYDEQIGVPWAVHFGLSVVTFDEYQASRFNRVWFTLVVIESGSFLCSGSRYFSPNNPEDRVYPVYHGVRYVFSQVLVSVT